MDIPLQYNQCSTLPGCPSPQSPARMNQACVKIIEQPARCALRFRYECEGRSAGSIPGTSSSPDNKTYPTIQVVNYKGSAVVVVSCVTKDFPYRPHPHNLVGKEGCKKGVCTMVINNPDMICSFTSLGIQCVKRKDIEESLKTRESIKVDPFLTGFSHKTQSSNIDLNVVRLCFQVFLEGQEKGKFNVPLAPIVSDPIYDKKAMSELIITKLSHCSASCVGGKEVILLCDRVTKDDIQVRFFEERNGSIVWEALADLQPSDVHKQVAICFRTPRYYNENIKNPVSVQLQLRRPSDGFTSDPRPFELLPCEVDPDGLTRKRQKIGESNVFRDNFMMTNISQPTNQAAGIQQNITAPIQMEEQCSIQVPRTFNIKTENPQYIDPPNISWLSNQQQLTQLNPNQIALLQQMHLQEMHLQQTSSNQNSQVQASNIHIQQQQQQQQQPQQQQQMIPQLSPMQNVTSLKPQQIKTSSMQASAIQSSSFSYSASNITYNLNVNANADANSNTINNNVNVNDVSTEEVTEKFDSLGIDIDPSELLGDIDNINFNSALLSMMDSGQSLSLNSKDNIGQS